MNHVENKFSELSNVQLPETGVKFKSADKELEKLVKKAECLCEANIVQFTDEMQLLVEGGGYPNVWLETQPMGGEMYAKRNMRIALNNQLVFMSAQRADGRLPGMIISSKMAVDKGWKENLPEWFPEQDETIFEKELIPDYRMLQGYCFPQSAFNMYFFAGKPAEYLDILAGTLEEFDDYLWKTRDPYNEGVLQSWCVFDTGEDGAVRFGSSPEFWPHNYPPAGKHLPDYNRQEDLKKYWLLKSQDELRTSDIVVPFRSMDLMGYSYAGRTVRSLIAAERGENNVDYWREKAEKVRSNFIEKLWCSDKSAAYDRNCNNEFMDILIHNNLRCMYFGLFSKSMAEAFVNKHLLNPEEFWTPAPLPSVAANDPLFKNKSRNNWSGQPQGLTWQRAIRALENYGFYSELTNLGRKILQTIGNTGIFTQQYDPFSPEKTDRKATDGYGPTLLAFLEYVSRMYGVHIDSQTVCWSGLPDIGVFEYEQKLGTKNFHLKYTGSNFSGSINGKQIFSCSSGVRVVTDWEGNIIRLVGIDDKSRNINLKAESFHCQLLLNSNQVWEVQNHDNR